MLNSHYLYPVMSKMHSTYSFTNQSAVAIVKHLREVYPGIPKIAALYYNTKIGGLHWHLSIKEQIAQDFEAKESLEHLRKPTKQTHHWLDKEAIPLDDLVTPKNNMNIFDEKHKLVLSMRFFNEGDKKQDIVYVEFRKDTGIFGLNKSSEEINTEHKTIIGGILHSNLSEMINRMQSDKLLWEKLNIQTQNIVNLGKKHQKSQQKQHEAYCNSIERLVKEYLLGYSEKMNKRIICSKEAMQSLRNYNGDLYSLKYIIGDALLFAQNLNHNSNELLIEEGYLNLEKLSPTTSEIKTKEKEAESKMQYGSREARATQYLYKLSKSVETLISHGEKITGTTVGALCTPSISAPAISDFINKYRNSITKIIQSEPEKWKLLSQHFRPISNLIDNSHLQSAKTA